MNFHQGTVPTSIRFLTYLFYFGSILPAVFGLGFAFAAIRLRGSHGGLATCGLVGAGAQLGLTIGIIALGLWHN